ncbi:bhlh family transcription factor [Fusarium sporotrichioides]|uniref:Bhlh family transcription factor n=1 Tax=Fusarium sporotrichioides TaxID=5514 RepID=A0A395RVX0_FUSSP|nr:bhlh family transcription factor [Fusarium sporotrichioides]
MLVVQHAPRMGSSQPPPDPFGPFGYQIPSDQDPPIADPPEPAPGAPLLSDNDSKFLSTFFDDFTADHYNMSYGEGLHFSENWFDLPPQFMGSSTSFGQQPGSSLGEPSSQGLSHSIHEFQGITSMESNMMPPPPPPPPVHLQRQSEHRHASDDVLNAAATLIQNGLNQRHHSNGVDTSAQRSIGPPVGHLRHQPLEEFREEHRRSVAASEQEHYPDWSAGAHELRQHRVPPIEYQWGSDANFNQVTYTPSSEKETSESLSKDQLGMLDCLAQSQSAGNTRPSSPLQAKAQLPHSRLSEFTKVQEVNTPPRKRRKSRNSKDAPNDETQDEAGVPKPVRRRKPKAERVGSITSPVVNEASGGKRRKSAANAAKLSRENLSEEQKRENHIKSEQKRRTLIKEGFDDLCELVPGLRGGGFSKSTMLAMAAEWLEDLLKGNKALEAQIATLEERP